MRINSVIYFLSVFAAMLTIGHGGIIKVTETGIGGDAPAIISSDFGEESLSFSDRTHQHNGAAFDPATGSLSTSGLAVIGLPEYLLGGNYIRFANNARENNPYSALVEADGPTAWYLLVDNRLDGFAGNTSSPNSTDPAIGGSLQWIMDDGWQRVNTGISPNGQADYTGVDEGGNAVGAGFGLNQFYSVYTLSGVTALIRGQGIGGSNMLSLVAGASLDRDVPIRSFNAPPLVSSGDSAELRWAIHPDASLATITPGVGSVLPATDENGAGTVVVNPAVSTVYTLTVESPEGNETKDARITVRLIESFEFNPKTLSSSGDPVTLSWQVRPDAQATITGVGPVDGFTDANGLGSMVVTPAQSTAYTLSVVANDAAGETETGNQALSVAVIPAGTNFALLDIGATGGRPEPGALGASQVGAAANGQNGLNLPPTSLTSETGVSFTIAIDNISPEGVAVGRLDWRDRGDGPGTPETLLIEDLVKNNEGMVRVSLAGLPAGDYEVVSYHFDPTYAQCESIAVLVSDANGIAVDTGLRGSAFVEPPVPVAQLSGDFLADHVNIFAFRSDGINEVSLYFDGRDAVDREVPLDALRILQGGENRIEVVSIRYMLGGGEVSLDFTSRPGANYLIEASDDLIFWEELDDAFPSEGEQTTFTDFGLPAGQQRRFYRITENNG
jgi:hypothetical protein